MKFDEPIGRRLVLLLFILPFCNVLPAQTPRDTARAILDSASYYIMTGQKNHAERNIEAANKIGWASNDSLVILASTIGFINADLDNPEYVDSLLDLIHPFVLNIGEPRHFVEYYLDRAHVANRRIQYDLQIIYVDSALAVATEANDSTHMGTTYFELATAYMNINDHEATVDASRKALAMFEVMGSPYHMGYGNRIIGISFLLNEMPDSSLHYLFLSNRHFEEIDNEVQIAYNNVKIGGCLVMKKKWAEAERYLVPALTVFEKEMFTEVETNHAMSYLAEVYLNTGRPDLAIETAKKGYQLADSLRLHEDKSALAELIIRASLEKGGIGQRYMDTVIATQERMYEIGKAREVLDMREKYESKEKESRIVALDLEAKASELNAQRSRTWIIFILGSVALIGMAVFFLVNRSRQRNRLKMNELNRRALQLQINPHFFFNVLNSINHYITDNDQKAARYYLAKFARLMRLALENSQHETVPLGNELDLVEAYLKLEQMRRDKFDFKIEVDEDLRDVMVPPLMLQPFVENAVLHAFPDSLPDKGLIQIRAAQEADLLRVSVIDNGVGLGQKKNAPQKEGKTSLAISILRKRLATFGNKHGGIDLGPGKSEGRRPGTLVRINIPLTLTT